MEVVASVTDQFKIGMFIILIPLPILERFPKLASYQTRVQIYDLQKNYIMKEIERHEETNEPEIPRDFIDVYLKLDCKRAAI